MFAKDVVTVMVIGATDDEVTRFDFRREKRREKRRENLELKVYGPLAAIFVAAIVACLIP